MQQPNVSETFASIDIPMVDDPLFMSTSGIFLKNDNFNINSYKSGKQNSRQRRSPPFASADELSESELSELESRVARGDFALTPNDFNCKKSICSSRSSTTSCNSKNELDNQFNFEQISNEIESNLMLINNQKYKPKEEQKLTTQNHLQNKSKNTNQLWWFNGTMNKFKSMPCLTFTQQQQQQQINSSTLFDDSNNLNNCFVNKNNKINNSFDPNINDSQKFVDFCDNKLTKLMTRSFTTVLFFIL